jgi:hypothetical protein
MRAAPVIDVEQFSVQETGALNRFDFDPLLDPFGAPEGHGALPNLVCQKQAFFTNGKRRWHEAGFFSILEEARLAEEKPHIADMIQRRVETFVRKNGKICRDH